jgi:hypothetical protein
VFCPEVIWYDPFLFQKYQAGSIFPPFYIILYSYIALVTTKFCFRFLKYSLFKEETKLCVSLLTILIGKHVSIYMYTSKDILFHNPFGNLRMNSEYLLSLLHVPYEQWISTIVIACSVWTVNIYYRYCMFRMNSVL